MDKIVVVDKNTIVETEFLRGVPEIHHENVITYIRGLAKNELQALQIAKKHLGSSFNLLKSNGFLEKK
jgi:hypothetical protein